MSNYKNVVAGGFNTSYLEAGDQESPTVVLIHDGGFGTTAELCWAPVIERISGEFHVIAPDLQGWGHTDKAVFLDRSPYAARVAHVAGLCEALDLDAPAFVGASFGGSLTVRGLIADGNPWNARGGVSFAGTGGPWRLRLDELVDYEPSEAAARRLTEMLVVSMDGLDEHVRQRHENSMIPGHWESLMAPRLANPSAGPRPAVEDPLLDRVASLEIPLLLVEGRHDSLVESGWAERLAGGNPIVQTMVTEYAHEPNIDAPDEAAAIITNFLRGLDKEQSA